MWHNGPMLVLMETRGNAVIKKRLKLSDDGQTLSLEVIHIAPKEDKGESFTFVIQPETAAAKQ